MSFLDLLLFIFIICFFIYTRPLGQEEKEFGRNTTASLRGLAMLGIILHHIHNNVGYESSILRPTGYLATGLFFFISGYGNMLSLNKHTEVSFKWIINKLSKIYIPFFAADFVYYLFLIITNSIPHSFGKETIIEIISVSFPAKILWFPKIILLCFAVHWIAKKFFANYAFQNCFITICILLYMIIMFKVRINTFWYNSVICYPLGCIVAKPILFEKLLNLFKRNKILVFAISVCLFGTSFILSNRIKVMSYICPIFFSLACYYFSFLFKSETKILSWIGNNSFEFYLFHTVSLELFFSIIQKNKYIYALLVLIGSVSLVYFYLKTISNLKQSKLKAISHLKQSKTKTIN